MTLLFFLLLLAALICFVLAAFASNRGDGLGRLHSRINLVALGLAFWVTVPLVQTIRSLS